MNLIFHAASLVIVDKANYFLKGIRLSSIAAQ